jgi:hypothetical protein
MKIPTLNDRELERLLSDSKDVVAVLFAGGHDPEESRRYWKQFEMAAGEWGDKAEFVRIDVEENPSAMRQWCEIYSVPEIILFRGAHARCRINYTFKVNDLIGAIERVAKTT